MNHRKVAKAIKDAFFEVYKIRYKTYSEEGAEVAWQASTAYTIYAQLLRDATDLDIEAGW